MILAETSLDGFYIVTVEIAYLNIYETSVLETIHHASGNRSLVFLSSVKEKREIDKLGVSISM